MAVRVAVNGLGRMGRALYRASLERDLGIEVVAFNDLGSLQMMAGLLVRDSVYGRLQHDIKVGQDQIFVDGSPVRFFNEADPGALPWKELAVDVAVEATGRFRTRASASEHLRGGASRVVVSAPCKDADATIVLGVNTGDFDRGRHQVISNASCTTNCLAPVAKVLNDAFGIKRGLMTTVHATTATQKTVDGPSNKDWRGGRGILENIIPSSTGAAKAVGVVIPELNKKLTGMSFRVPTSDVSVIDLTVELVKEASYDDICNAMKAAADGPMKGVLGYTDEKVVSTDFRGEPRTSVFDAEAGIALDKTFVKVVAWYDNEWGYSNKVLEMARVVAR